MHPASKFLFWFSLAFAVFSLICLHLIPLPWIDSVGYLDPAYNLINHGTYATRLWPHPGTETFFFAHLPMLQVVHSISFLIFPDHWVWCIRLLPLLVFFAGAWFLYRILRMWQLHPLLIAIAMVLFLCDKAVFEMMRSMRMENLELLFLTASLFLIYRNKHPWLVALLAGLLALTHPKVWMLALLLFAWVFFKSTNVRQKILLFLSALAPALVFMALSGFDFEGLYTQLFLHGKDHTASTVPGSWWYKHFIGRFLWYDQTSKTFSWYYETQFYVPLLHLLAWFPALLAFKNGSWRNDPLPLFFLGNEIYWMLVLGPFHKYNMVLLAMSYLLLIRHFGPRWLSFLQKPAWRFAVLPLLLLFAFPVYSRFGTALVQWNERSPKAFTHWLEEALKAQPHERILLIEPSTAWYYAIQHENIDFQFQFWLFNNRYEDYDRVYYLHNQPLPDHREEAIYQPENLFGISRPLPGMTHKGLRLYRLNKLQYEALIDWERKK